MKPGPNWNHLPLFFPWLIVLMLSITSTVSTTMGDQLESERIDITPNWWEDWYKDRNGNGIDDSLDEMALSNEELVTAIYIDYDHKPTSEDQIRLEELGLKVGQLLGTVRVAVSGKTVAPPLFETLSILGRERTLSRIDRGIVALSESGD